MAVALFCGCNNETANFPSTLEGVWETRNVLGEVERIKIDANAMVFGYGNDEQKYSCSYRVPSYYEKENVMDIWLRCPRWTGNPGDVAYKLQFTANKKQFTLALGGRPIAVFTNAALVGTASETAIPENHAEPKPNPDGEPGAEVSPTIAADAPEPNHDAKPDETAAPKP